MPHNNSAESLNITINICKKSCEHSSRQCTTTFLQELPYTSTGSYSIYSSTRLS